MDSVVYWFKTEVYFWRSAGSLFWSAICLPPLTLVYIFFCHLSLFQPWIGISGFFSDVLSVSFHALLLALTGILMAVSCSATYTVVPEQITTCLQKYLGLLRYSRLPQAATCVLGGACFAWCCTHFMGERFSCLTSVIIQGDRELHVLNESHLFIVLSGAMTGLIFYTAHHLYHLSYLAFPVLQRDKYFRVRSEMVECLGLCRHLVWKHIRLFYLFYFLLGGLCRSWIIDMLNLDQVDATNVRPLDTALGLLDFNLFWHTFLLSFFIIYSWNLSGILYRVYHTQRLELPVQSVFSSSSKSTLTEALACSAAPLLQHLAFLDLSFLSGHDPVRRQQVYSLSQPGGHPHTWRAVCSACLQQVDLFTARVHAENLSALSSVPFQPTEKIFQTAGLEPSFCHTQTQKPINKLSIMSRLLSAIKDKPIFSYFLMEQPDAKRKALFAGCQIQIWAIEALSHLCAFSYKEDKYGVVQQALPAVFSSLIALQDNIEKHFKLQPLSTRRSKSDLPIRLHALLWQELRVTLKTSIYRLTNVFGRYLGDLQLSTDCLKRLKPFQDYKE